MKNNYFIIHGSFGNPFVNWFPYLIIKTMNNIDLMNYWIESSDKDYEVMIDL